MQQKLRGRLERPRGLLCDWPISVSSCWPFSLSFWLPWLPILPSIVHGSCNGLLLQLSECIESLKSEVKQKMMLKGDASGVRKSWRSSTNEIFVGCAGIFLRTTGRFQFQVSGFQFRASHATLVGIPEIGNSKPENRRRCRSADFLLTASIIIGEASSGAHKWPLWTKSSSSRAVARQ